MLIYFIPALIVIYINILLIYVIREHKLNSRMKKEAAAQQDICTCGHERLYHSMSNRLQSIRCFEFDDDYNCLCKCIGGFRQDNLRFLEDKYNETL
jgi:hypothetical protein